VRLVPHADKSIAAASSVQTAAARTRALGFTLVMIWFIGRRYDPDSRMV
jgi:hypothetical protein